MIEYGQTAVVNKNGRVFRSRAEALWVDFFTRVREDVLYEPTTFMFEGEDFVQYTPDLYLPRLQTYIEIKNKNLDEQAVKKANTLARYMTKKVIILDGQPKNSTLIVLDGRTPNPTYSNVSHPAVQYAAEMYEGQKAAFTYTAIRRVAEDNKPTTLSANTLNFYANRVAETYYEEPNQQQLLHLQQKLLDTARHVVRLSVDQQHIPIHPFKALLPGVHLLEAGQELDDPFDDVF